MKPKKWAAPKPAMRWGLFDGAGDLVLTYRTKGVHPLFPNEMWHRVRVTPIRRKRRGP